jgi:F-type H+-transporting ATPase subunit epsilon
MLHVKIITPDSTLFEGNANAVTLPGANGSFQILNGHAPIVSSLVNGSIEINDEQNAKQSFDITGGIVEVLQNKVIVLV